MLVVTAALAEPRQTSSASEGLRYGIPLVFKDCAGFFHPAAGSIGVVLCPPWGFENLSMRKGWRLLAETIAQAGYPCLRFDYPGTGDSLGTATQIESVAQWIGSIDAAADALRKASGVRRFVFIGQSLGATLAIEAARGRGDIVGLQLIAAIAKGRPYLRELAATAAIVTDRIGIASDLETNEGLSVLGFSLSPSMVESLKALDLTKIDRLAAVDIVIHDQPDRTAGALMAEHLRKLGARVALSPLEPFHVMVSDATTIQPLPVDAQTIVQWLRELYPVASALPQSARSLPSTLVGPNFAEEPVRFGRDQALFGILCKPLVHKAGAPAVVLLNRGLNSHVGWRRQSVEDARALAKAGVVSLRIDVAGLGESRDEPGRPVNLIYSDLLLPDISAAIDLLCARGYGRIALAGVCSGAYMALTAACADPRVTDVVSVNPQRLVWNPTENVDEVIRYGLRSMNDYLGDIRSRAALRKLVRSRKRIVPAMRFLARRGARNMLARVPLRLRSALLRGSMEARVHRFFETLAANGTRVSLVYTQGDPGLMEMRHYFGESGRDMRYANVSIAVLGGSDHNLTSTRASAWLTHHLVDFATVDLPREAMRATRPARTSVHAVCTG